MKFYVTIAETFEKIIEVDAKDPMDARIKVENDYYDSKYVLDADDFVCTDFYVEESEEKENKLS